MLLLLLIVWLAREADDTQLRHREREMTIKKRMEWEKSFSPSFLMKKKDTTEGSSCRDEIERDRRRERKECMAHLTTRKRELKDRILFCWRGWWECNLVLYSNCCLSRFLIPRMKPKGRCVTVLCAQCLRQVSIKVLRSAVGHKSRTLKV